MKITRGCLVGLAISLVSIAGADTLRTVALSGTAAPGTAVEFSSFDYPVLNNNGQVAFPGHLVGSGVEYVNRRGIWSEGGGSLGMLARSGNTAPESSDDFLAFSVVTINDTGFTSFLGYLIELGGNSSSGSGIWSDRSGDLSLVASSRDDAPGANLHFRSVGFPLFNNLGQIAFLGSLDSAYLVNGIWSERNGPLALVAALGDRAPGSNSTFTSFESVTLGFNNAGQTVFSATLSTSPVDGRAYNGIWSERSGSLDLVALEGEKAPGTNANFYKFGGYSPVMNDAGKIAFKASLTDEGVSLGANDFGIWSEKDGPLALVARTGERAPGTETNFFDFSYGNLSINSEAEVAFRATVVPSSANENSYQGIWSEGSGSLSLVALKGSRAPGTDTDFTDFGVPILNDAGQTAFMGTLSPQGEFKNYVQGIWAQDLSGVLTLIARTGDLLDVDDGSGTDFRTVSGLLFVGGATGGSTYHASGFNDRGQVAFYATFTDGTSGIFVSNLVAIPEPASSMLLLAALAICGVRRRQR